MSDKILQSIIVLLVLIIYKWHYCVSHTHSREPFLSIPSSFFSISDSISETNKPNCPRDWQEIGMLLKVKLLDSASNEDKDNRESENLAVNFHH